MEKNGFSKQNDLGPERNLRRKDVFEILDRKINFIKGIKKLIDGIELNEDVNVVETKIRRYLEQMLPQNIEVFQGLAKIEELEKELDTVINRLNDLTNKEKTSFTKSKEFNDLELRRDELLKNIDSLKIKYGPDFEFLDAVRSGLNLLIRKFRFIQKIKDDNERIIEELNKDLFGEEDAEEGENGEGEKIDKNTVKKIIVSPFSINVILEKKFFNNVIKVIKEKEGPDTVGFHLAGSPFNVIMDDENQDILSETINHENIHNLTEGFLSLNRSPLGIIESALERADKIKALNPPRMIMEIAERYKKEVMRAPIIFFIDQLHGEIIADIERVERFEFLIKNLYLTRGIEKKRRYVGFTTAQNEIIGIKKLLIKAIMTDTDIEIRENCNRLLRGIDKAFDRAITYMRKALFISRYINYQLEVHSLIALLKPSKFRHIERYLKYRCGNTLYEGWSSFYRFLSEFDASLNTMKAIASIKDNLPERERSLLKEELESVQDFFIFAEEAKLEDGSIDDIRNYIDIIESFDSILHFEQKFLENFKEGILWSFFFFFLEKDIKNNFINLPDFVNNLTPDEKKVFNKTLESYFLDGLAHDDLRDIYEIEIDQSLIKSLPLWDILVKLKLDKIVQNGLDRFEEFLSNYKKESHEL